MQNRTKNLMDQLAKIDCPFARYWNANAATALDWTIANASGKKSAAAPAISTGDVVFSLIVAPSQVVAPSPMPVGTLPASREPMCSGAMRSLLSQLPALVQKKYFLLLMPRIGWEISALHERGRSQALHRSVAA